MPRNSSCELLLHIGMPKTGTSSLQHFLYKNRSSLLEKEEILYPSTGLSDRWKRHATFCSRGVESLSRHDLPVTPVNKLIKELKQEIKFKNPRLVIVSSEDFFLEDADEIETLFNKLKPLFSSISLLVYLRRQDDFLTSMYLQRVKGDNRFSLNLDKYLNNWLSQLDYMEVLNKFSMADQIKVVDYHKTIDIVSEFRKTYDIRISDSRQYRVNNSLDYGLLQLKKAINRNFSSFRHTEKFQDLLHKYLRKSDGCRNYSIFTSSIQDEIQERFRISNAETADKYRLDELFQSSENSIRIDKKPYWEIAQFIDFVLDSTHAVQNSGDTTSIKESKE